MIKNLPYVFAGIALSIFLFAAYSDGRLLPFIILFMITVGIICRIIFKKIK